MTFDCQLKLQAYLDGELPPAEANQIEQLLAGDSEARALADELRQTMAVVRGNELPCPAPAPQAFYWSQIQRQILSEQARAERAPRPSIFLGWRRLAASFVGVAAVFAFVLLPSHRLASPVSPFANEIEVVGDQTEAVVFHDQTAKMTMVWLQPRTIPVAASISDGNLQQE